MRNFKKILMLICVLSLLAVGCTVWALADGEETNGSVAELSKLITIAEKADDETKYDEVKAIRDYLDTHTMNTEEDGYDGAILRINCLAVESADIYLSKIPATWDESLNLDDLIDTFLHANELLTMFDIPDGTAGFSAVKNTYDRALYNLCVSLSDGIGNDIINDPNPNTAKNQIKINRANSVITFCDPYTPNAEIDSIKAEFAACIEAHEAAVAKKLDELDRQNDVSSYELPLYYTEDWEKKSVGYGLNVLGDSNWSFQSQGTINQIGIRQEKNGNKYYVHEYRDSKNPGNSYVQRSLSGYKTSSGLVFEFSVATFGDIPAGGIQIETGSINGSFPPAYFYINANGDICANNKSTVLLEGALVKGGWIDVIIALDPVLFQYNLYVEGQYIGSYDAAFADGSTYDHSAVAFRLSGGNASASGEVCFDNFKIYAGSNYRNHDRLTNMTPDEQLVFFVENFTLETNPILARKNAYDKVTPIIRNYCTINSEEDTYEILEQYQDNEAIKNAVDTYFAFDIDSLVAEAKLTNLKGYADLVKKLGSQERSLDSIKTRNEIVGEIDSFNKINLNLIDDECDIFTVNTDGSYFEGSNGVADYDEFLAIYSRVLKQIDYDTNSSTFVGYMQRFKRATASSATQRYYSYAKSFIDDDLIDLNLILIETTPYRENFKDLIEAYDIYVNSQKKIDEVNRFSNSKRIVQCVNIINIYRTEEQWDANREFMMQYLLIVRDSVFGTDADGNKLYDETYNGIDEALRFYHRVYAHFYAQMQDEHDEYIGYLLDLIAATDDYVEKIGLVALVDRYVDTNDVDYTDPRIAKHLSNLETCRSELVLRGEDYSKLLHQNSVYFVNYVAKMRTAETYAKQVEYYEKATLLYFSLDATVEGTAEAIEIYDEYDVKLKRIKESSVKFLEAMALYRACENEDDKYEALVECYYNAQFAEVSYEGVAEALAEYRAAYDAYINYANAVNSDLLVAGNAVGSLRVNCGITVIIAIIVKKIFGV